MSEDVAIFDRRHMINENGATCVHVKEVDGDVYKLVTDNEDETLSAWFANIDGEVPEKGSFINIKKFKFTAVPKGNKFPVKLIVTKWEYYSKNA